MYVNLLISGLYLLFRILVQNIVAPVIINHYSSQKNYNTKILTKFRGAIWRSFIYSFLLLFGFCTLYNEKWITHPSQYRYKWSKEKTPYKIDLYYKIEVTHYFLSLILIFLEPKMKDFYQMVLHHIITLYLITTSYKISFLRYGTSIMLLHDFSDPFMEIGKAFFYLKQQKLADTFFMVFAASFIVNKCILYPTFIVYPICLTDFSNESKVVMLGIKVCLVILVFINFVWSFMIIKMAIRLYKDGCLKDGDIRVDKSVKIK